MVLTVGKGSKASVIGRVQTSSGGYEKGVAGSVRSGGGYDYDPRAVQNKENLSGALYRQYITKTGIYSSKKTLSQQDVAARNQASSSTSPVLYNPSTGATITPEPAPFSAAPPPSDFTSVRQQQGVNPDGYYATMGANFDNPIKGIINQGVVYNVPQEQTFSQETTPAPIKPQTFSQRLASQRKYNPQAQWGTGSIGSNIKPPDVVLRGASEKLVQAGVYVQNRFSNNNRKFSEVNPLLFGGDVVSTGLILSGEQGKRLANDPNEAGRLVKAGVGGYFGGRAFGALSMETRALNRGAGMNFDAFMLGLGGAAVYTEVKGKKPEEIRAGELALGFYGAYKGFGQAQPLFRETRVTGEPSTKVRFADFGSETKVSPSFYENIYGSVKQKKYYEVSTQTAISKLRGKKPDSNLYSDTTNALFFGERNKRTGQADFDLVGKNVVRNEETGKVMRSLPFEAKGVQFNYNDRSVTGLKTKERFMSSVLLDTVPVGVVPVRTGQRVVNSRVVDIFENKPFSRTKSRFEESSISDPANILSEGSVFGKTSSKDFVQRKKFTVPERVDFFATRNIEVKEPKSLSLLGDNSAGWSPFSFSTKIKENVYNKDVLTTKGFRGFGVSKRFDSPSSSGVPSASYLEAYKRITGENIFPKVNKKVVVQQQKVIDLNYLLENVKADKSAKIRAYQQNVFSNRMEKEFPNKIPSGLDWISKATTNRTPKAYKTNSRSGSVSILRSPPKSRSSNGNFDFGGFELSPPITSFGKGGRFVPPVNIPKLSISRDNVFVSKNNFKQNVVPGRDVFSNQLFGGATVIKQNQESTPLTIPGQLFESRTRQRSSVIPLFDLTPVNEKGTVLPSFTSPVTPFFPKGGVPAWLGGSGSKSGSRPYAQKKSKTKYDPSLAGLFLRIKKGKSSSKAERLGFGVRGV